MDNYFTPTDIRRVSPFSSNHPNHCKKNIPCTLARRICTIVENQQQKLRHLSKLKKNLNKYDYPIKIITNGIQKAEEIPQKLKENENLKKPKENEAFHLFLHIIQMILLYKTQLRIPLKSLRFAIPRFAMRMLRVIATVSIIYIQKCN